MLHHSEFVQISRYFPTSHTCTYLMCWYRFQNWTAEHFWQKSGWVWWVQSLQDLVFSVQEFHYRPRASDTCLPCDCYPVGSFSRSCDPETGQCQCRPGVIGRQCNMCDNPFAEVTNSGCEGEKEETNPFKSISFCLLFSRSICYFWFVCLFVNVSLEVSEYFCVCWFIFKFQIAPNLFFSISKKNRIISVAWLFILICKGFSLCSPCSYLRWLSKDHHSGDLVAPNQV